MNKTELVDRFAEQSGMQRAQAARHLDAFLEVVGESLKSGEEVQITGFGKSYANERAAREARNPQTGQQMTIPAKRVPSFSAGNLLKEAV